MSEGIDYSNREAHRKSTAKARGLPEDTSWEQITRAIVMKDISKTLEKK